jgi:histidinol-phosphate aminotransferase
MYAVSAAINNVELLEIPLNEVFQIELESVKFFLSDKHLKLIFICSPNNPTGNLIDKKSIEFILKKFNGIVIVDEAYIDFSEGESLINLIAQYNNLIVSQTLSKAWGLAAARIGLAYADIEIISFYNKVKPPYNVSELNQKAAIQTLKDRSFFEQNRMTILREKERLEFELNQLELVKKLYPSDANFLLIELENADEIYTALVNQRIITRNRNKQVANCIRISIGTEEENTKLLNALKNIR